MARPQDLPYNRKDVLRAFAMFAQESDPEGFISLDALEQALVSQIIRDDLACSGALPGLWC